jgi:hypothetical protein
MGHFRATDTKCGRSAEIDRSEKPFEAPEYLDYHLSVAGWLALAPCSRDGLGPF